MFFNAKTTKNRDTPPLSAELKAQDILNVIDHIELNIINTLSSVARQISRPIYLVWRPNKINHIYTPLSV